MCNDSTLTPEGCCALSRAQRIWRKETETVVKKKKSIADYSNNDIAYPFRKGHSGKSQNWLLWHTLNAMMDEQACVFIYKSSLMNFLINNWQVNFIAKITIHCVSTNKLVQTDIKLLLLTCKIGTVIPKLPVWSQHVLNSYPEQDSY